MLKEMLNIIAPSLGLVGTILIFRFGIPYKIDTDGKNSIVMEQEDEEEKKRIYNYKKLGAFGLILIMISFFIQIITSFFSFI